MAGIPYPHRRQPKSALRPAIGSRPAAGVGGSFCLGLVQAVTQQNPFPVQLKQASPRAFLHDLCQGMGLGIQRLPAWQITSTGQIRGLAPQRASSLGRGISRLPPIGPSGPMIASALRTSSRVSWSLRCATQAGTSSLRPARYWLGAVCPSACCQPVPHQPPVWRRITSK